MSLNSSALAWNEASSCSSAGSSSLVAVSSAARWTADGKTSLEDCPMLTWSLGWTPSPASAAITSLAFMLLDVPDPVWNTSSGNWSSNSPSATRSAAAAIRSASSASSSPRSRFTRAAAALIRPSQWITDARDALARDREVLHAPCWSPRPRAAPVPERSSPSFHAFAFCSKRTPPREPAALSRRTRSAPGRPTRDRRRPSGSPSPGACAAAHRGAASAPPGRRTSGCAGSCSAHSSSTGSAIRG